MRAEPREQFKLLCRELETTMVKKGLRLRIALHRNRRPETFLLRAKPHATEQTYVYTETEATTTINGLLSRHGANAKDFVDEAARTAAELRRGREKCEPVVWNDPGLVISGIAPGILKRWRLRRDERLKEMPDVG